MAGELACRLNIHNNRPDIHGGSRLALDPAGRPHIPVQYLQDFWATPIACYLTLQGFSKVAKRAAALKYGAF